MQNAIAVQRIPGRAWREYGVALALGWVALALMARAFARSKHVPTGIAVPIAAAFLTEYAFYLLLGFADLRDRLRKRFGDGRLGAGLAASAILPYLICAVSTGIFAPRPALVLAALAVAISFWFTLRFPPSAALLPDLAFMALLAAIVLSGVLRWIFPPPMPKLPLEVLGHITLLRTGMLAALLFGRAPGTGVGFIPRARDFALGSLWFVVAAAVDIPLGRYWNELHPAARVPEVWQTVGLLLGVFWVLALSEEFFFRGMLQHSLARRLRNAPAALLIASLLFGAVHLGFRGRFPNWHFAALATVLGLCCGAAFQQARSIRASMITHVLAVGAWRIFLT